MSFNSKLLINSFIWNKDYSFRKIEDYFLIQNNKTDNLFIDYCSLYLKNIRTELTLRNWGQIENVIFKKIIKIQDKKEISYYLNIEFKNKKEINLIDYVNFKILKIKKNNYYKWDKYKYSDFFEYCPKQVDLDFSCISSEKNVYLLKFKKR